MKTRTNNPLVVLDTVITPELKEKGMAREIIHSIQELRKRSGYSPKDTIILLCDTDEGGEILVRKFADEIKKKTRTSDIIFDKIGNGVPVELDDVSVSNFIKSTTV